jgi:glucose-6-phosphate-specific signal transduction histidine kinase
MGFGMRGMQERVQGLGGSYTIGAADGGGTVVEIAIRCGGSRLTSLEKVRYDKRPGD